MRFIVTIILCCSLFRASSAQTSYPFVYALYPAGLQRGTSAKVHLYGLHNYNGAYRVLISGKGLTGEVVVPTGGWPPKDAKTGVLPTLNEIDLKLTSAPDAAPGTYEVRVATPRGVSSVGLVVIGDELEIGEKEPNNELAQAEKISLPVTVNGRLQQAEDVDSYKFHAEAGETVSFAVVCSRIQDRIHDLQAHAGPLLRLIDSTGKELTSGKAWYRADPLMSHTFKQAGDYTVQIRDVEYTGNPYWVYRLTITNRPWVTTLLPAASQPGQIRDVRAVGFNIPAGGSAKLKGEGVEGIAYGRVDTSKGPSNPVPYLVSSLNTIVMGETSVPGQPMALSVPSIVSSRLSQPGQIHQYKFKGKAGQRYTFDLYARRFDAQLDAVMQVLNSSGGVLVEVDDTETKDPRIEWQAPADGEYSIKVRDVIGGGGDDYTYVLKAVKSEPYFLLRSDDDKMQLGPGQNGCWYIHVDRHFGFAGDIRVDVKGLPPGITAAPLTIPGFMTQGALILSCADGAKPDVSMVEVSGTSTVKGEDGKDREVTVRATPQSEIYLPGGGRALMATDTQAVAVSDSADIQIDLSTTQVTLKAGQTARIDVTIRRSPTYKKGVTLDVFLRHLGSVYGNPLPPGITLDEGASKTLIGENETKGHIVLKAAADARPVTNLPLAVLGSVSINFVVKVSYSGKPVLLTVVK